MIYDSIVDLIGNTPLVRLHKIEEEIHTNNQIYAKLEKQNPAGSIKDRAVISMLLDFQKRGLLHKGTTIVEPTSGNTGIALAALGNYYGYHIVIVMPATMSEQRKQLIKAYSAELVLVDGGMPAAIAKAQEILKEVPGSLMLSQFDNPANPAAHYLYTGKEILDDLPDVDYVLAGIGTGGTISGIGHYLKEHKSHAVIVGLEPASSPFLTTGVAGKHKIQGIGAGFAPANYEKQYVDYIRTVSDDDAINTAKDIAKQEGYLVGISSGAALSGAISLIKEKKISGQKFVVIFPDTGERYSWN